MKIAKAAAIAELIFLIQLE